ncbi:GntR family transcriptional regulator [Paenibacillus ihuae]|uniref:GntR family transcriptional regulator n=1 Tax=Paenibacillus ihuae TaxID=1232431 RepID=UPI0006D5B357|nr:GntR family transcriptional regulator [Paenibacillus ihuae]
MRYLPISLAPQSSEPIYVQIREQLRHLIAGGILPDGEPLPSLRELAEQLACSLVTVRRVYADLEREGLLSVRRGIGTFVKADSIQDARDLCRVQVEHNLAEAVRLGRLYGMPDEEIVFMLDDQLRSDHTREV